MNLVSTRKKYQRFVNTFRKKYEKPTVIIAFTDAEPMAVGGYVHE